MLTKDTMYESRAILLLDSYITRIKFIEVRRKR